MQNTQDEDVLRLVAADLQDRAKRIRTAYVEGYAQHEYFKNPVNELSWKLQRRFKWTPQVCQKKVREVLRRLETDGRVAWLSVNRRSTNFLKVLSLEGLLQTVSLENRGAISGPGEDEVGLENHGPVIQLQSLPTPINKPKTRHPSFRILKKGIARLRRKKQERGNKFETQFSRLLAEVADIVQAKLPQLDRALVFRKSGRHNLKKGKIDIDDHHGADFFVSFVFNGEKREIIYDVKGNFLHAQKFNRHIRFYPEQNVALKKAIVVNPRRSNREIVEEILDDLALVSGLDFGPSKELVTRQFV